jgi:hypothetical protein
VKIVPCKYCGETIWLIPDVNTGRSRPINPEERLSRSAADGNIVLVYPEGPRGRAQCRQMDAAELASDPMHYRHLPHQATCGRSKRPAA